MDLEKPKILGWNWQDIGSEIPGRDKLSFSYAVIYEPNQKISHFWLFYVLPV